MGGRLSAMAKGRLLRLVDSNLQNPTAGFLKELELGTSMVDLGLAKGILKSGQESHVNDEVFGDAANPKAWWPTVAEKEAIVRGGFIEALRVALLHTPKPVPIECFWVIGLPDFEVIVTDSPQQVSVFLLTPEPRKALNPALSGVQEAMWVVATEPRCDALYAMIPPNYNPTSPQPVPGVPGVRSLKLWGY